MGSENLHEPADLLSNETKDLHRAVVSLMEELEAVDWYQQRAEATEDIELSAILTHNKNEEVEHAMMTLEWIRRHHPVFAANIKTYLNTKGPITELEDAATGGDAMGEGADKSKDNEDDKDASKEDTSASAGNDGSLGIGSLKVKVTP